MPDLVEVGVGIAITPGVTIPVDALTQALVILESRTLEILIVLLHSTSGLERLLRFSWFAIPLDFTKPVLALVV